MNQGDEKLSAAPLGFGMALAQNIPALNAFSKMSNEQKNNVIEKSRSIQSKNEMRNFVDSLNQME